MRNLGSIKKPIILEYFSFTATTTYSFVVWDFDNIIPRDKHEIEDKKKKPEDPYAIYLKKDEVEVQVQVFCKSLHSKLNNILDAPKKNWIK